MTNEQQELLNKILGFIPTWDMLINDEIHLKEIENYLDIINKKVYLLMVKANNLTFNTIVNGYFDDLSQTYIKNSYQEYLIYSKEIEIINNLIILINYQKNIPSSNNRLKKRTVEKLNN